jgi:hypothetical protein
MVTTPAVTIYQYSNPAVESWALRSHLPGGIARHPFKFSNPAVESWALQQYAGPGGAGSSLVSNPSVESWALHRLFEEAYTSLVAFQIHLWNRRHCNS